jgi:hypothetical protein
MKLLFILDNAFISQYKGHKRFILCQFTQQYRFVVPAKAFTLAGLEPRSTVPQVDAMTTAKRRHGIKHLILRFKSCRKKLLRQGCQIFLDTTYQNEGKYTKLLQHYSMAIKYIKWP